MNELRSLSGHETVQLRLLAARLGRPGAPLSSTFVLMLVRSLETEGLIETVRSGSSLQVRLSRQ